MYNTISPHNIMLALTCMPLRRIFVFVRVTGVHELLLNIAVKWTAYLHHTQQVTGLDINLQTNNPEFIMVFLSPHSSATYAKTTTTTTLLHTFQFIIHSSFYPLMMHSLIFFLWRNSPYQT